MPWIVFKAMPGKDTQKDQPSNTQLTQLGQPALLRPNPPGLATLSQAWGHSKQPPARQAPAKKKHTIYRTINKHFPCHVFQIFLNYVTLQH